MADRKTVTRFAPSPTGNLHIGGARTALFNWAFARRHGGTFILRIEDTDRARSTPESTRRIIEDLKWLGLDWDEGPEPNAKNPYQSQTGEHGPYFQSQRLEIYRKHIAQLLQSGRAYKCFKTPAELAADREEAKQEKRPYKYDRTESVNLSPQTIAQYKQQGRPCVIRFRMPDTDIIVPDLVLGDVTLKAKELEDFIILKSDGYPTFHLANVVDDALMDITHVLRAQEHLMNTPKHVALQEALGFTPPQYAHMPLIFNADGSKMSKRDKAKVVRAKISKWMQEKRIEGENDLDLLEGLPREPEVHIDAERLLAFYRKKNDDMDIVNAVAHPLALDIALPEIDVQDFRASGYLPEVVLNYISLLGWSPGNNLERFDLDYLQANFDLERIGKSNARFDRAKLLAFNTDTIAKLTPDDFHDRLIQHDEMFTEDTGPKGQKIPFHKQPPFHKDRFKFKLFAASYQPRCQTLQEPFDNGRFFILEDNSITYDPKAVKKVLLKNNGEGFAVLREMRPLLEACGDWTASGLEAIISGYAQKKKIGLGKAAQPLRVAVSGSTVSPPIYETLVILGKDSTLARIDHCLELSNVKSPTME